MLWLLILSLSQNRDTRFKIVDLADNGRFISQAHVPAKEILKIWFTGKILKTKDRMVNFFSLFKKKRRSKVLRKKVRKPKKALRSKIKTKKLSPKKRILSKIKPLQEKEIIIGKIAHYFPKVHAGVISLRRTITQADQLHFKGHTTDFKQIVTSIQINRIPIKKAKKGDEIGMLVNSRVRRGDLVYKTLT